MKAIILAGGKGTRLRPYTVTIPKPLLPIGDSSALELLVRQLAQQGVTDIRMTVAYKANMIQAMLGDGQEWNVNIDYFVEEQPLGTAGCLGMQQDWIDESVLVCNGDLLTDIDFAALMRQHREAEASITIGVRPQQVPIPYGVVEFADDGQLQSYTEKPTLSYWVSMGVYVVRPSVVELIERGKRLDMPDLHLLAKQQGHTVQCVPHDGEWYDIGAFEDYNLACEAFAQSPDRFFVNSKGPLR